jgi:aminopeptidase
MDPRIQKLAEVLVFYSLQLKAGQQVMITSNPLANELTQAVYAEALRTGAFVNLDYRMPEASEIFLKLASDAQLDYIPPQKKILVETFDAHLYIEALQNTRDLSGTDPARQAHRARAHEPFDRIFFERASRGELNWCLTVFPTHASAQEADMSLADYTEFVFRAGRLDSIDPVAAWQAEGEKMRKLAGWLAGHDQVVLKGPDIDLAMSIKDRIFLVADGRVNFPDGEIFTGPVEDSVNGWVRFAYPAIFGGREATDIELWFEEGKVVREKAAKGQELLTKLLDTDEGSRFVGELGIGTNYDIPRFTKNMLFDEKLGGTIHLAVGASYPDTGGLNHSGLHWDMLCDMREGEIWVDGELFYKDGKPIV